MLDNETGPLSRTYFLEENFGSSRVAQCALNLNNKEQNALVFREQPELQNAHY